MSDPVTILQDSRRRFGRLALARTIIGAAPPLLLIFAGGALAIPLVAWFERATGYLIYPGRVAQFRSACLAGAILGTAALIWLCRRDWRRNAKSLEAAELLDQRLDAKQELLTLAAMADAPENANQRRSPFFALLRGHALARLKGFDPQAIFPLNPLRPLAFALISSLVLVGLLAGAGLLMASSPTAAERAAIALRNFADHSVSADSPLEAREKADAARAVANDLENPKLPPQQKLAELETLKRTMSPPAQPQAQSKASGTGSASGAGKSSSQAGRGSGSGGAAQGSGPGSGSGASSASAKGSNSANNSGKQSQNGGGTGGKQNQQSLELQNDLNKAEAKLQEQSSKNPDNSQTANEQGAKGQGKAPQPGNNSNQSGGDGKPNGTGDQQVPTGEKLAQNQPAGNAASAGPRNDKGTQGDTHLGDFPKAANYERYKLGDKGPELDIKDARYVTFRIPPATIGKGGGGNLVADSSRPSAATPYTNAPLKPQRVAAAPDEQQLVPPRYRDLIK